MLHRSLMLCCCCGGNMALLCDRPRGSSRSSAEAINPGRRTQVHLKGKYHQMNKAGIRSGFSMCPFTRESKTQKSSLASPNVNKTPLSRWLKVGNRVPPLCAWQLWTPWSNGARDRHSTIAELRGHPARTIAEHPGHPAPSPRGPG